MWAVGCRVSGVVCGELTSRLDALWGVVIRAHMAHLRQSRPDSGLDFQVKVSVPLQVEGREGGPPSDALLGVCKCCTLPADPLLSKTGTNKPIRPGVRIRLCPFSSESHSSCNRFAGPPSRHAWGSPTPYSLHPDPFTPPASPPPLPSEEGTP